MSTEIVTSSFECAPNTYRERVEPLASSHNDAATGTVDCGSSAATTYWGVKCRTCQKLVAFDVCPYLSFGIGAASMKPGAICCSQGHNHIYFPRDFQFVPSAATVPDEVMRVNRETYRAINATFQSYQGLSIVKARPTVTASETEASVSDGQKNGAELAEKDRWSHLTDKKAM
jgi:hypothetical protein